ncbi:hypothetical protein FQR65_LT11557 [Abscondita terminalis]|nr:hypothetical protein FQR65_LT11557 [Abscondita terminalis]
MRDKEQQSPHSSRSASNSPISEDGEKKRKRSVSNESKSSGSKSRSRSRSYSSERDGYRLHIADIGDHVRKSDLEKVFSPFGNLKELWLTHSSPIFGFAVFKTKESASAALKGADGVNVGGSRIRVTHARPRTRGQGRRFFHPNMRCYQCGYAGHFYRDCPDLDDGKGVFLVTILEAREEIREGIARGIITQTGTTAEDVNVLREDTTTTMVTGEAEEDDIDTEDVVLKKLYRIYTHCVLDVTYLITKYLVQSNFDY